MNHSPRAKTEAPNHDDMNTPTRKMNVTDVANPRPIQETRIMVRNFEIYNLIGLL